MRSLVEVAFALDDAHVYQYACEKLYALTPQDRHLPYMLTRAYLKNNWLGLALTMGRRALAQDPANEKATATRQMLEELEPFLNQEIARVELTGDDGLECLILHDQVRSFLDQGRYARAREAAEQLATRRPRFPPAYNNGAETCFHDGQPAQAIALLLRLLQLDPDNVFALANLVRFLCGTGKVEEARGHAQRLLAQPTVAKPLAVKQAETLAWLGDDAGVLAVFERGRNLESVEGPEDDALLYHLAAVAAFRQGREEEARGYWQAALQAVPYFELAQSNLDDLRRPISERNAPWSYSFNYFVPRKLVEDLLARLAAVRGKDKDAAVQRETQRFLTTHPELEGLVPLLLERGDGAGRELALQLAGLLRTPVMLQAVRDFALGQGGSDKLRLQAVQLAEQAGVFPAGPRRFWMNGAWRTTKMQRFEIHGEAAPQIRSRLASSSWSTAVSPLFVPAMPPRGARAAPGPSYRPERSRGPEQPGGGLRNLGREDESEAISNRLLERHPDYLFARTALASLAAEARPAGTSAGIARAAAGASPPAHRRVCRAVPGPDQPVLRGEQPRAGAGLAGNAPRCCSGASRARVVRDALASDAAVTSGQVNRDVPRPVSGGLTARHLSPVWFGPARSAPRRAIPAGTACASFHSLSSWKLAAVTCSDAAPGPAPVPRLACLLLCPI